MKDKATITIEYLSIILKFISILTDNKSKKVKKDSAQKSLFNF